MRHFGQSREYWENTLTIRLHIANLRELAEDPPPEFFLAAYFRGNGWWQPPQENEEDFEVDEEWGISLSDYEK
jgi:hypothetical protein